MKKTVLLLFPWLALANISNVRVAGTTATQAVLSYTAPDNNACTVAVSTSAGYSPLAHDVDPALFTGSNSDARAGSVSVGRSRVVVVGKRSVERDLSGNNSSRALQAATAHYFQIACPSDNSTASGTFTTRPLPNGVGYADPIPVDPAGNGSYLYPTLPPTSRSSSAVEPHTGALVRNFSLPGDLQSGGAGGMGSSGTGPMCHPTPVKASDENKYGYHCQVSMNGYPALYWLAPDGETRFLGIMSTSYTAPGWNDSYFCQGLLTPSFDRQDPNSFYCVVTGNDPGSGAGPDRPILLKATYSGHNSLHADADLSNQPVTSLAGMPHTTYTQAMPWPRDLATLVADFDPNYATYGASCCDMRNMRGGDWANGKFVFYSWSAQDTPGWIAVYDPLATAATQRAQFGSAAGCIDNSAVTGSAYAGQAGCIVASTGTFTGGGGSLLRWSVLHAPLPVEGSPFVSFALNVIAMQTGPAYRATLSTALTATPGSCTMTKPAGSYIGNWPDSSWSYGCSTIKVTGEPVLSATHAGYLTSIAAAPGDFLSVDSSRFNQLEVMRLLDKGADGKTWYVQRRYYYGPVYPYASAGAGGTLDMLSPGIDPDRDLTGAHVWWDPVSGALSTDSTNTYREPLPPDHVAYLANAAFGRWTAEVAMAQPGGEPGRLTNPPAAIDLGIPTFNGQGAYGDLAVESHPSLPVLNPPDLGTFNQMVDNHPYFGNANLVSASNVALVGGQLYRIRGANVASGYKLIPYFANSGSRAMKEVSGPSVRLATDSSTQFEWCMALNSGECYSGSLAGDIYFNAPNVVNPYCTNNWGTLQTTSTVPNDICVSQSDAIVEGIRIREIAEDPAGLLTRMVSNALGKYDQQSNFWNSRTLPDGSWLFTTLPGDGQLKLIKVPPRVTDSVNRTGYVPVNVSVKGGAGVDNAIVEFGYQENGSPASYYCTARQETCVAQSGSISRTAPFYFETTESGAISGMPCSSGCTIAVPAMPDRVLYYRVSFRDRSGKVVGRQEMTAVAAP